MLMTFQIANIEQSTQKYNIEIAFLQLCYKNNYTSPLPQSTLPLYSALSQPLCPCK